MTEWATPRAEHDSGRHRGIADTLHSQIKEVARDYWLSPTVEDAGRMGSPEWAARWASGEVIPETQQRLRTQVLAVWPTPSVGDVTGSRTVPAGTTASGRRPDGKKAQIGLQTAVRAQVLAIWPTPTVCGNDNRKGASPTAGDGLGTAVRTLGSTMSTPTVNAAQNATAGPSQRARNTPGLAAEAAASAVAPLSPDWVETLMGFPVGWTRIDGPPVAAKRSTPASPRARRRVSRSEPQG